MTASDFEAAVAELVRAHRIIEDLTNAVATRDAQLTILRAVMTQILQGARDPVSLAEIALREAT